MLRPAPAIERLWATRKIYCRDFVPDQDRHPLLDLIGAVSIRRRHNGKNRLLPATLVEFGWLLKNSRKNQPDGKGPPERCAVVRDETTGQVAGYLCGREYNQQTKSLEDIWRRGDGNGKLIWQPYRFADLDRGWGQ